jgi:hypothetical protein
LWHTVFSSVVVAVAVGSTTISQHICGTTDAYLLLIVSERVCCAQPLHTLQSVDSQRHGNCALLLLSWCFWLLLQGVFPPGTFPSLGLPDGWYRECLAVWLRICLQSEAMLLLCLH